MKKWQKNRNYKRIKDKDGNVVANIINVFGQDVEVSDEVFAQRAKYRWNARLRTAYISKRWKMQNQAQKKSAWNTKMQK